MTGMSGTRETISVRVQPNAGRNRLAGLKHGILHVKLAAPPVEGRANAALIKYLSTVLDVPRNAISIERGLTGRNKVVAVAGMDRQRIVTSLKDAIEGER